MRRRYAAAMTTFSPSPTVRSFVPDSLDPADVEQLEPLYRNLIERELPDTVALRQWLTDFSELTAVIREEGARRDIAFAARTNDPKREAAYLHFVEKVSPAITPWSDQLHRKFVDCPHTPALLEAEPKLKMLERDWRADIELYREANIPLQVEESKLRKRFDQIAGSMSVDYRGKTRTLQQMARFVEDPDRGTREEAYRLIAQRRLQDREALNDLLDEMFAVRAKIAANADQPTYREYIWQAMGKFDYTPDHCAAFADAVEAVVVPRLTELHRHRREKLGVDRLRPWDTAVDLKGLPPLQPFDGEADDAPEQLRGKSRAAIQRVSPRLVELFEVMKPGRNLDLESRDHKRPGGFQSSLTEAGEPFIFMNAAGLHGDIVTMLHEAGHAFHYLWSRDAEELIFLQQAPLEFCEVASMFMELAGVDGYEALYEKPADRARAALDQYERSLNALPWIATIDQFQHWLYTHPGHSVSEREDAWEALVDRFGGGVVDYDGLGPELQGLRRSLWQRQIHIYCYPFYYIEYGFAQMGALQLWRQYREDRGTALDRYESALRLGGTRTLPELFNHAGLSFEFTPEAIAPSIEALWDQIQSLRETVDRED